MDRVWTWTVVWNSQEFQRCQCTGKSVSAWKRYGSIGRFLDSNGWPSNGLPGWSSSISQLPAVTGGEGLQWCFTPSSWLRSGALLHGHCFVLFCFSQRHSLLYISSSHPLSCLSTNQQPSFLPKLLPNPHGQIPALMGNSGHSSQSEVCESQHWLCYGSHSIQTDRSAASHSFDSLQCFPSVQTSFPGCESLPCCRSPYPPVLPLLLLLLFLSSIQCAWIHIFLSRGQGLLLVISLCSAKTVVSSGCISVSHGERCTSTPHSSTIFSSLITAFNIFGRPS